MTDTGNTVIMRLETETDAVSKFKDFVFGCDWKKAEIDVYVKGESGVYVHLAHLYFEVCSRCSEDRWGHRAELEDDLRVAVENAPVEPVDWFVEEYDVER